MANEVSGNKIVELYDIIENESGIKRLEGTMRAARIIDARYLIFTPDEFKNYKEKLQVHAWDQGACWASKDEVTQEIRNDHNPYYDPTETEASDETNSGS